MGFRARAAGLHLIASLCIAALAATLVFWIWYPPPLTELTGSLKLFVLFVSVDVTLGPLLTAVAASPRKPRKEFRRDVAVILALQLAAFGYGMYTIALGRPAWVAFEIDRLRVVSAAEIEPAALAIAAGSRLSAGSRAPAAQADWDVRATATRRLDDRT